MSKPKVLWSRDLSANGLKVQVVEDGNADKILELVPPHGADWPAAESGQECVRISKPTAEDIGWLMIALCEVERG